LSKARSPKASGLFSYPELFRTFFGISYAHSWTAVAAGKYVNIHAIINTPAGRWFTPLTLKALASMKIKTSAKSGFTLVEIMIVVAIIGLLAAIAVPNFIHARGTSQQDACISNLRQIDGAVQTWALETKKAPSDTYVLSDIYGYVKLTSTGTLPSCPGSGVYAPGGTVSNAPTCTLSTATLAHLLQ
jgi:prepilin-type N-terminal cleavage/methylation domain-containing protein